MDLIGQPPHVLSPTQPAVTSDPWPHTQSPVRSGPPSLPGEHPSPPIPASLPPSSPGDPSKPPAQSPLPAAPPPLCPPNDRLATNLVQSHLQGSCAGTDLGVRMTWVQTYSRTTSRPCDRPAPVATLRACVSSTEDGVSDCDLRREGWGLKQEDKGAQSAGPYVQCPAIRQGDRVQTRRGRGGLTPHAQTRCPPPAPFPGSGPGPGQDRGVESRDQDAGHIPDLSGPQAFPENSPGPCGPARLGWGRPQA